MGRLHALSNVALLYHRGRGEGFLFETQSTVEQPVVCPSQQVRVSSKSKIMYFLLTVEPYRANTRPNV